MTKNQIIGSSIAIFLIGIVVGNYAVKLMHQPPEPSTATQSLIGSPLPQFSLPGLDGVKEDINQWQVKVRVVNFWATWCPPCKREIPAMIALQESFGPKRLQFVGISLDNKLETVKEFASKMGMNYPILLGDEAIDVAEKLGNDQGILPYTVIVDQLGNVAYVHYGELERADLEKEIKKLL